MTDRVDRVFHPHSAHWGVFSAAWNGQTLAVRPHPGDPDPNPLLQNFPSALRHRARVAEPMVRRGWLDRGPGPDTMRGQDGYVPMPWPEVLDRVADELRRVQQAHGIDAIFGGSYGWASAGRFHHAQSQVHRFLNTTLGGYVRSVNSYSAGASGVILPHILGSMDEVARRNVTWEQIVEHSDVVLAFGGMALRNSRVASGGISRHIERESMRRAAQRGCRFVNISPLLHDLPEEAQATWLAARPGTDTALMLGLAHTLVSEGLHDRAFLADFCDGWDAFEHYLMGRQDGLPKTARWAARVCGLPEATLLALARSLAAKRVLVVVAHSLQRAEHGEQPVWMGAVLAALLGQIGLPGGGYSYALGTLAHYGKRTNAVPSAALPQGTNGVKEFIPVARIADMLLHPGEPFDYNGQRRTYPHVRLAYWAGGNPFHHHQDINRLRDAFRTLDTLIVHELAWTATAKHADIVLPCTMTLEREDIGARPTPKGAARATGCAICTRRRAPRWRHAATRHRTSTPSGSAANCSCRSSPTTGASCARFATTRAATRCPPRAARFRSAPRRSPASAMPTAPGTRPGCRRRRLRTCGIRCSSWRISRPHGCTASSTSAATAPTRNAAAARCAGCIRPTPRHAPSPTATSCGCSTTAAPASRRRGSPTT